MSWLYSRALVEEYSAEHCSDGKRYAPLNMTPTPQAYLWRDKTTEAWSRFPSGMTFEPLTADLGAALLTWYLGDFLANRSAQHLEAGRSQKTCGPKCCESSTRSGRQWFLPRMLNGIRSGKQPKIWQASDTPLESRLSMRPKRLQSMIGVDGGWLPTPTAKANHSAPSMRKWPAYHAYQDWLGRKTSPQVWEWMMGWPIGWTDLKPLAMHKYRQWRRQHG